MSDPVDIVITWVDGDDPEWLASKRSFEPKDAAPDSGEHRFRDWGTLRYIFRGIEQFMPWVETVHFVTWGHLPAWLNTSCGKLNVVRHEDFIPWEYLPTFSSHTIELNFHRIEGLSERFIYFNDDTFVISPVAERDFFHGDLPCDTAALNVHCYSLSRPVDLVQVCDVGVINEHFDFKTSIRQNWSKWLRPQNGTALFRTLPLLGCPRFPGFYQIHCPHSLLKNTYEQVWAAEHDILDKTCRNRFRKQTDVNQWVFREWQMASGSFAPRKRSFCKAFYLDKIDPVKGSYEAAKEIKKGWHPLICINDADMTDAQFHKVKDIVSAAFDELLPNQSCFELG